MTNSLDQLSRVKNLQVLGGFMTDPTTVLTASTIATLAFQKFIESGGGELGKKFTTEAIIKMGLFRI